jgi:hypothetical protein
MELTDDAKKLIEDHCKSILEQNRATLREGEVEIQKWKDTLREADIYVWAARAFFFIVVLALGGSIYGIFKTQDYLDERIAKNTSNLERLFYAKSLSDSGQTPDALPEMLEFARYVSSSPQLENLADNTRNLFGNFAKAGPSIRSYFFINLLDVVSSIPTTNPEDTSFGRTEWEQLLKNTTFRTEILANPRWANDQRVLNNLGLATAKFAEDRSGVLKSKPYFAKQERYAQTNNFKSSAAFCLAIFNLADGDTKSAGMQLSKANLFSPKWVLTTKEYFVSPDQFYWVKLFASLDDFKKRYEAAIQEMDPPIQPR